MTQKPTHELKLGRVKAVIWKNDTTNGARYNAVFSKLYRVPESERKEDDNGWRESSSFSRDDISLLMKVADLTHLWMYTQNGKTDS